MTATTFSSFNTAPSAFLLSLKFFCSVVKLKLEIGCSGIGAYYDDEVNAFVEKEGMVLYALAIGR
jgi:hypothetical protein